MHAYRNIAGGVVGVYNPLWNYELLYFIKHKNDLHVPAVPQELHNYIVCLASFCTIKVKILGANLFDVFFLKIG